MKKSTLVLTSFACLLGPGSLLLGFLYCQINPESCGDAPFSIGTLLSLLGQIVGLFITLCALVSAFKSKAPKSLWLLCSYWACGLLALGIANGRSPPVDSVSPGDENCIANRLVSLAFFMSMGIFLTLPTEIFLFYRSGRTGPVNNQTK